MRTEEIRALLRSARVDRYLIHKKVMEEIHDDLDAYTQFKALPEFIQERVNYLEVRCEFKFTDTQNLEAGMNIIQWDALRELFPPPIKPFTGLPKLKKIK